MQPYDPDSEQSTKQKPLPLNQYSKKSSTERTLQPLSSEEDIRNEARAANYGSQPQANANENILNNSDYVPSSSSMITEPLQHRPQTMSNLHTADQKLPLKSGSGKKFPLIVLLILAVVGAGIYYFFNTQFAAIKLVRTSIEHTTYVRPENWKAIPLRIGLETYASLDDRKHAVSTVTVDESTASIQYHGNDRPSDWYEKIRTHVMSQERVDSMKILFRNGGKDCTSEIKFNVIPDTNTNNKMVGLALATATCTREDGVYIVKRRTVANDNDILYRHITVGASESSWSSNKSTFNAILDSVNQAQ